eukprot:9449363-Alexandrium_andersonii.AAC.1
MCIRDRPSSPPSPCGPPSLVESLAPFGNANSEMLHCVRRSGSRRDVAMHDTPHEKQDTSTHAQACDGSWGRGYQYDRDARNCVDASS